MAEDIAREVEAEVAWLSRRLTEPHERECLRCFLLRMINEFGCDGTRRSGHGGRSGRRAPPSCCAAWPSSAAAVTARSC